MINLSSFLMLNLYFYFQYFTHILPNLSNIFKIEALLLIDLTADTEKHMCY